MKQKKKTVNEHVLNAGTILLKIVSENVRDN